MMEIAAKVAGALTQSQTLMQSLDLRWLIQSSPEPSDCL